MSGGGGGGGAGAVSWPTYLQDIHNAWLDNTGTDTLTNSMVDAMNAAYGNSPYSGDVAYNPDTDLTNAFSAVTAFNAVVDALSNTGDYATAITQAIASVDGALDTSYLTLSEATIQGYVDAFEDEQDDQFDNKELPAFRAGMLNIGAVQSSAFTIGEAVMRAFKNRDRARFEAELRHSLYTQDREIAVRHHSQRMELITRGATEMIAALLKRGDLEGAVARLDVETRRMRIVAKKEESDEQRDIDTRDALWDLETFQYGANLIGSISGGIGPTQKAPSKLQSALGGALSGAATGAMIGSAIPGIGTAAGAAIGGMLGIGGAFL